MRVGKVSGSFDPDPGDAVRAEALAEFLDGWEAEHGAPGAVEVARAKAELGLADPSSPGTARVSGRRVRSGRRATR